MSNSSAKPSAATHARRTNAPPADAILVCYPLHRTKSRLESAGSRVERIRELDLGGQAYVHNTYSERRQRRHHLARRRRPAAEVDDPVTFSEGDGHGRAGLEDFRR